MRKLFFKILKKDIKRKKAMNIILFLFMITASMLIAGSVNMLYSSTTALENFKRVSNTPDNIIITYSNSRINSQMKEWTDKSNMIQKIASEEVLFVTADDITLPSQHGKLTDEETLALARNPKDYNLVFDENDQLFEIKPGEVALPIIFKGKLGIKVGEELSIKLGKIEKKLVLKTYVKDVLFGSELMGLKRIILSDKDYEDYYNSDQNLVLEVWSIIKNDNISYEDIDKDFGKTSISSISTLNSELVSFTYIMDLITAVIMIIVSIFLILISFLILRFTIVFTVEEDYKEIGIMKAIGLKNNGIKRIYMVKYLALSLFGGILGFIASIPLSLYLLASISQRIIIKTSLINYILSAISVIFIILITSGFCYLCTRKINNLSAIDAIRQGSNGERFSVSKKLKLHRMKHISTPVYLALSDIISGFRRFKILIITFILGTAIIIIPINIINTLNSNGILSLFGLGNIDFRIGSNSFSVQYMSKGIDALMKDINQIEQQAEQKGVKISIYPDLSFMTKIYSDNPDHSKSILSFKAVGYPSENYTYLIGTPPKLENEIAISDIVAEYFGVSPGDTINCSIDGQWKQFIITATYQIMNNLGYAVRYSDAFELGLDKCSGFMLFGEVLDEKINKTEAVNILKDSFPELGVTTSEEYIDTLIGSVLVQLNLVKNIILVIVLGINFLITSLLVRMLLTKEIPEVALLKAIGFRDKYIWKWQAVRIVVILIVSVILGALIANLTGGFLTSGVFKMMGATKIELVIEPIQVFLIYPLIILLITMAAVFVSLGRVKKTNIWEINNQE